MFKIRILVLLLSVLKIILCHKFLFSSELHTDMLLEALGDTIKKTFSQEIKTLNIISATKTHDYESDFVRQVLLNYKGEFTVRLDNYKRITNIKNWKKKYNVILLESIEMFRIFDKSIKREVFNFKGFYIFTLIAEEKIDQIQEIFDTLWKKNIYNIYVIYTIGDAIEVATFMPFGVSSCHNTAPRVVVRYQNGSIFKSSDSNSADKFKNLFNCPIIISTFDDHFSVIRTKAKNGTYELSGFDLDLVNELSKALNFKADIRFYDGPEPWGYILANGTSTGSLGEIINNRAQIAVGRYYLMEERRKVADSSISYFSFPAVLVISPGRPLTDFEKLLRPFSGLVWISLMFTLLLAVLVIINIRSKFTQIRLLIIGRNVQNPSMNLINAVLGGTQKTLPNRNFARFILMLFIIFCLVMRSAYVGSLYKFLQSEDRKEPAATIQELIDQNYELHMYRNQLTDFGTHIKTISKRFESSLTLKF